MFMYGSILIAVTFRPVVFNNKPVEEAEDCLNDGLNGTVFMSYR